MKNILYILPFLIITTNVCCSNLYKDSSVSVLKDSMFTLIQNGTLNEDTMLLQQALRMSDTLLSYDLSKEDKIYCYNNRAMIYAALGHDSMAIKSKEMELSFYPEDNIFRLSFYGLKHLHYNNKDSACFYFEKVLCICDRKLDDKYDVNVVLAKTEVLYYMYGEHKAKEFLKETYSTHPKEQYLKSVLEDWDEYKKNIDHSLPFDFK